MKIKSFLTAFLIITLTALFSVATAKITLKAPATSGPYAQQMGSSTANVPMKHGSCGLDCGTHVLAVKSGNLNMKFKVGMTCPKGKSVNYLSYKPTGQNHKVLINKSTNYKSYAKVVWMKPFSMKEMESACRTALGGNWAQPGGHKNNTAVVNKTITKTIGVWGRCSGWANTTKRNAKATLTLRCRDNSFYKPEG